MDFNADIAIRKILDEINSKEYKPNNVSLAHWKHLTEAMLRDKGVKFVCDRILEIAEGINDKEFLYNFPKEVEENKYKTNVHNNKNKNIFVINVNKKLSILEVAKRYGFDIKKNKSVCKFHGDSDPSLVFYPETNSFFCFGCRKGGNIITFIKLCKINNIKKING